MIFWNIYHQLQNLHVQNLTHQTFLHVQNTQTLKMDNPCFCQMCFFTTKCAPLLLKIGEDFNIDD
jgi:hypothetical protein